MPDNFYLDQVSEETSNRLLRLRKLQIIVNRHQKDVSLLDEILHSTVTMLYAHWEGYIKFVVNVYFDFLESRRLTGKQCKLELNVLALESNLDSLISTAYPAKKSNRIRAATQTVHRVHFQLENILVFNERSREVIIAGKLNLENIQLIGERLCIDFDTAYESIGRIGTLINDRNDIGHGVTRRDITSEKVLKYMQDVASAILEVEKAISNSLIGSAYSTL